MGRWGKMGRLAKSFVNVHNMNCFGKILLQVDNRLSKSSSNDIFRFQIKN